MARLTQERGFAVLASCGFLGISFDVDVAVLKNNYLLKKYLESDVVSSFIQSFIQSVLVES